MLYIAPLRATGGRKQLNEALLVHDRCLLTPDMRHILKTPKAGMMQQSSQTVWGLFVLAWALPDWMVAGAWARSWESQLKKSPKLLRSQTYAHTYLYTISNITYIYIYICICVNRYVYIYVQTCMVYCITHRCTYVYIYIYIHIYIYIYVCACIVY